MKATFLHRPTSGPRSRHLLDCFRKSFMAGGGVVTDEAPGLFVVLHDADEAASLPCGEPRLGAVTTPFLPAPSVASYGRAFAFSGFAAEYLGIPYASPCADFETAVRTAKSHTLNWSGDGYRFWSVIPPHELPCVYPLVSAYLREWRATDPVTLFIRVVGDTAAARREIENVTEDLQVGVSKHARIVLCGGAWDADPVVPALAKWGHCCVLPWSGADVPIEALYAMAAGNYVVATDRLVARVLDRRAGSPIASVLQDGPEITAVPDWEQTLACMRAGYANSRKSLPSAIKAAGAFDCRRGEFFQKLLSVGAYS